jgi:hypothetical protein
MPFAEGRALDLGLIEAIHDFRSLTRTIGVLVTIHAESLVYMVAFALAPGFEALAHGLFVGLVVPAISASMFDFGAIVAVNQQHAFRAGSALVVSGCWLLLCHGTR